MGIIEWFNDNAGFTQFLLVLSLVGATFYYARKTSEIAGQTRSQAEASIRQSASSEAMLETAIEQSIRENRPVLAMEIARAPTNEDYREFRDRDVLWCRLRNIGRGPALNAIADLRYPEEWNVPEGLMPVGSIGPGAVSADYGIAVHDETISVEYADLSGRRYRSRSTVLYDDYGSSSPGLGVLSVEELPSTN